MKIVFDYQIFASQPYGGISRYFYETAKRLAVMGGCGVEIFAPWHINEYLTPSPGLILRGRKITRPPYTANILRSVNSALTRIAVKPRKDIDIFHETYFTVRDNCPRSAKRVITVYDMIHEKFSQYFSKTDPYQRRKVRAVCRADHVICISENTRRDLVNLLGVPRDKTSVVYLACSFPSPTGQVNRREGDKPFILYVGNRDGHKNFEGLLRAFASSKLLKGELSIICFGGGPVAFREKKLMASLGLSLDQVMFTTGHDSALAEYYASAAIFVYPSFYEGFGIPVLEAMSCGCPVVCANAGSIPEVAGEAAELFAPENISQLRAAMEKVVFSPGYANELMVKGYDRIKLFSWEKCAADTLRVYEKVLRTK